MQRNAMDVWKSDNDFKSLLGADAEVAETLTETDLDDCFDAGYFLRHVDNIYENVLGPEGKFKKKVVAKKRPGPRTKSRR